MWISYAQFLGVVLMGPVRKWEPISVFPAQKNKFMEWGL